MPSAVDFLPCHIIELMNFVTRSDPYIGSASTVRFGVCPLRGIQFPAPGPPFPARALDAASRVSTCLLLSFLRAFCAVLRASLITTRDTGRIERSAHHVITHARQIFHAASANQHD